jgi:hypothetical protein
LTDDTNDTDSDESIGHEMYIEMVKVASRDVHPIARFHEERFLALWRTERVEKVKSRKILWLPIEKLLKSPSNGLKTYLSSCSAAAACNVERLWRTN